MAGEDGEVEREGHDEHNPQPKDRHGKKVTTALPIDAGRWATITPVRTPTITAKKIAVRIRRAVGGIFSRINSRTGFP
jgi:hypothetical protein